MERLSTTFAALLTIAAPLSAHAATTDRFSYARGGAVALGVGVNSCVNVGAQIRVAEGGAHNLSSPSTTGYAYVAMHFINTCTGSDLYEYGYSSNFQFAAPGAPNAPPQSVRASGTVTTYCIGSGCGSPADTLTFSVDLQTAGDIESYQSTVHYSIPSLGLTVDEHFDGSDASFTTGSVSLSSQNFGALPISNWYTTIDFDKAHELTLTY